MKPSLAKRREELPNARELVDELEEAIEHLRLSYEKYFVGVDKAAPARLREKVERRVRLLERVPVRTTALRFRMGGIRARFVTYKHYWTRMERQLEMGISRRDLLRMRRGLGAPTDTSDPQPEETASPSDPEARPGAGPPPPPDGKLRRPPPASNGRVDPAEAGLDPKNLREVFKQLVKAKKAAGESTDGLTYAALCRKLTREAPKLREKHKCEQVRFEVQTVGGRVRLRARPD
jgi:hypothetical protein